MKKLWNTVVQSAEDLQKTAGRLLDGGMKFFRSKLGTLPLLSSGTAFVGGVRDETHHFLVPTFQEEGNYALYRIRSLPNGVGPENDLPKARIFQLPASGTKNHLINLLTHELTDEQFKGIDPDSPLVDRLETIADEIDYQSNLVSGGLVIIGGAIAIANPLLGAGIAAKSLLPGLGAKLTTHGVKHASDWLRERRKKAAKTKAQTSARKEANAGTPEIRQHPLLSILEKTIHDRNGYFDHVMESRNLWDDPTQLNNLRLRIQAIGVVHENRKALSPVLDNWMKHPRRNQLRLEVIPNAV
ncbi:hypothetical protein N9B63_01115 [Akkermansiaceae bacterium]|nr:hypothetical protein [Akkermansiaceae bacterium]MDB4383312.1 hypothetical protein [Akkermansiaceae bacterium]